MTIKVLEKALYCMPKVVKVGDWIDLYTAEDIEMKAPEAHKMHIRGKGKNATGVRTREVDFDYQLIPLGVAMAIPKGYEAYLVPRSSTFHKYGILQTNSIGVIDFQYRGDDDEWKMPAMATRTITIPKGTRIAQFRVQLSQKATIWQKVKWLFTTSIKLEKVNSLNNPARGGFGSTGD